MIIEAIIDAAKKKIAAFINRILIGFDTEDKADPIQANAASITGNVHL
jgi:hypothetical protein